MNIVTPLQVIAEGDQRLLRVVIPLNIIPFKETIPQVKKKPLVTKVQHPWKGKVIDYYA